MPTTASITVKTDSSGTVPFTIHVDASACTLSESTSEDYLFEWDFGEPTPSVNGNKDNNRYNSTGSVLDISPAGSTFGLVSGNLKNKVVLHAPTLDSGCDNTGYSNRSANTNNKQQGFAAAYTYYTPGTYTVTLSIRYGGVVISSTTTSITVSSPGTIYNSWASMASVTGSWITLLVRPSGSGTAGSSETTTVFKTIEDAFGWINRFRGATSGTVGKVRIALSNADGTYEHKITNTIQISTNNLVVTGVDYSYLKSFSLINTTGGNLSGPSAPTPLISITGGAKNIYFENISFKGSDDVNSTNIIGIQVNDGSNITLHNCDFSSCYYGIQSTSTGNSKNIYINSHYSMNINRVNTFKFVGKNIVLNNIEIKNGTSRTLVEKRTAQIDFTNCTYTAVNWCNIDSANDKISGYSTSSNYGFLSSGSSLPVDGGIFSYNNSQYCTFISNIASNGCNSITGSSNIRFDGNYMSCAGGGQKSSSTVINSKAGIFTVGGTSNNLNICNNVLELNTNNIMGNNFCFSGLQSKHSIKILNNTNIQKNNVSYLTSVWDFKKNGASITGVQFVNNLHTENKLLILSYTIGYDDPSIFSLFSNNVYSLRDPKVRFGLSGSSTALNFSGWTGTTAGARDNFRNMDFYCLAQATQFSPDISMFPSITTDATGHNSVNQDYSKSIRTSLTDWSVGASKGKTTQNLYPYSVSSGTYTCNKTITTRNRPTNPNASLNDSDDFFLEIIDTGITHQNSTGVTAGKIIMGKPYDYPVGTTFSNWLSGVGDYIKTGITSSDVSGISGGIDVFITYTNDGPSGQTYGSYNQLGALVFDSFLVGRNLNLLSDINVFNFDDFYGTPVVGIPNTSEQNKKYPHNRFCPATIFQTDLHGIGISYICDWVESDKEILETVSSSTNIAGTYDSSFINRRGKVQIDWTGPTGTTGYEPYNRQFLGYGKQLKLKVSIRIVKNPAKWPITLEPLKTHYERNNTYTRHCKDPRPVYLEVLNNTDDPAYLPLQFTPSYGITATGYTGFKNSKISAYNTLGYERFMFWDILGYQSGGLNYYPQILTPIYKNQYPYNSYPKMLETISVIRDLGEELPQMGFYQGYADTTVTTDKAYGATGITYGLIPDGLTDSTNTIQKFYDEIDLACDKFWADSIGLDFFGRTKNINQWKNSLSLISSYNFRYPNLHIMAEKSIPDIACFKMASYLFTSDNLYSPHDLANYLIPGNEHWCIDYGPKLLDNFSNVISEEVQWRYKNIAAYGYIPGGYGPSVGLTGATNSSFWAADRRFDFSSIPDNFTPLTGPETPQNLSYGLYEKTRSSTYTPINQKYNVLFWDPCREPDFSHYIVYKSSITGGVVDNSKMIRRKYTNINKFFDQAIREGNTYNYQISSVDVFGNESEKSEILSVPIISNDSNLNPPTGVTADLSISQNLNNINWSE